MEMDLNKLNQLLQDRNIFVLEEIHNGKSSESYVRTTFVQDNGFKWETVVPYYIRRSSLFIETEEDLAEYLVKIKPFFTPILRLFFENLLTAPRSQVSNPLKI